MALLRGNLLFVFFSAALLLAASSESRAEKLIGEEGPIVITSSKLSADNKARIALFEGSVVAKTGEVTLFSNLMRVHYSEEGKVMRIEAEGNVRLTRGQRAVVSEAAEYIAEEEKIIFTGGPVATEGENVITGKRIIYLMKEDRSVVEESRVFLKSK